MDHASIRRLLGGSLLAALLLIAACGGDATSSGDPVVTSQPSDNAPSTSSPDLPATTMSAAPEASVVESAACHDLFSDDEVSELFGEPAVLDSEQTTDSIGGLVCAWGTIEDPDNLADTAAQVLTVQVYSGDPVPGASFYDTSFYENVREIGGIGEKAFVTDLAGVSTGFLDGDVAGFVSYSAIVFGDTDQVEASEEQVIEFLRKLHQRVN